MKKTLKEIPVYELYLPEYQVVKEPNHNKIGAKVDKVIKKHFMKQHIVVRCLGSREHPGKTIDSLIKIIKKRGWDRYHAKRKGDRYENIERKKIDFFAFDYRIGPRSKIFHIFTWPFYNWCLERSGYAVRIDIIIIYDWNKVKQVFFTYAGRENEGPRSDGFTFKNPKNKPDAILGIIKITGGNGKCAVSKKKGLHIKKFLYKHNNNKSIKKLKQKAKK